MVENSNYRNTLNIDNPFSTQLLIKVLLQMTVEIEVLISAETNSAPGGGIIMHNCWSKFSKQYSGLFASFNRKVKKNIGRVASGMLKKPTETKETIKPNIVSLSVSPLYTIVEEDTDELETTQKQMIIKERLLISKQKLT